jgi:integrase
LTLPRGIHTAVTALFESGVSPSEITSLAVLVTPDALKRILRRRIALAGQTVFNRDLGQALVQIAREWVKGDAATMAELKRLVGKMPAPAPGLTDKNKAFLRQFDDSALKRLLDLPGPLWREVQQGQDPDLRRLAKAQAAIAIAMLPLIPLRPKNLTALVFGTHLFLRAGARDVSSLELSAGEVKNGRPLEFDIPRPIARMLIEYRERIAPEIIGHRPGRLFVNVDGSPKCQEAVSDLIIRTLRRRAGIIMTPHQFRHLSAKLLLDSSPGDFVSVSQLLGHKNLKTTTNFYGGIDSRRAARHHQALLDRKLAEIREPLRRRKPRNPAPTDLGDRP